ncbi:MAG: CBS domain-containing protein [Candidatus Micrarchaeia archaeon]|jgi:CBS domain-containing protein
METQIKVGDCMTKGVLVLSTSSKVKEAAEIMANANVGSIILMNKGKAVGIATERDIVRKVVGINKDPSKITLEEIMSRPLRVIKVDTSIGDAALAMRKYKIKKLPVIDKKGMVIGMITETDIISAYPGLVDVLIETALQNRFTGGEVFSGVCEHCGVYSEQLKRVSGTLLCSECREEEDIA